MPLPRFINSHDTLVQTASNELSPMHTLRAYGVKDTLMAILFFLVIFSLLGLLIWFTVDLSQRSEMVCDSASVKSDGEYYKFSNRTTDVYNGRVAKQMTGTLDACKSECKLSPDLGADCSFFTRTKTGCNLYTKGVLTGQNANAALVGPTQLSEDVYVKKSVRYVQLVGAFGNERSA